MSVVSSTVVRSRAGGRRRPRARSRRRLLRGPSHGWLGWVIACTWALASTAWAVEPAAPGVDDNVRYSRPPPKIRVVKDPKAGVEAARKEAAEAESGPSSAGSPWLRQRTDVELAVIDDQLRLLEALLRETDPADKEYPDFLFRYADLHLDRKAIFEDQAGALYEQIHALEEAGKPKAARQALARQRALQQKARAASEAAVRAYATLVFGRRFTGPADRG